MILHTKVFTTGFLWYWTVRSNFEISFQLKGEGGGGLVSGSGQDQILMTVDSKFGSQQDRMVPSTQVPFQLFQIKPGIHIFLKTKENIFIPFWATLLLLRHCFSPIFLPLPSWGFSWLTLVMTLGKVNSR